MKRAIRVIAIASLILLGVRSSQAQWTADTLTNEGRVYSFAVNGANLFAGTDSGVFLSTDNGASWTAVNNGLTIGPVYALAVNGTYLFAAIEGGGIFRSGDNGNTWTGVFNGSDIFVFSLGVSGTNVLVGTESGLVYVSTDNGNTYSTVNTGLMTSNSGAPNVSVFIQSGSDLFAAGYGGGVVLSTDNGASWTPATNGLDSAVDCLAASGSTLFAGTDSGVFISSNNGTNWQPADTGLTLLFIPISAMAVSGTDVYAGSQLVFKSTDNGNNWVDSTVDLPGGNTINAFAVQGAYLFAGTTSGGISGGVFRHDLPIILPVELAAFSGSYTGSTIELQWKTATELNNSGFQVEKKVSGQWKTLGFVKGAGTSNATHTYSYADKNISGGVSSYRLMQVDHNGKTHYSQTISVNASVVKEFALRQNYPNPFNPSTVISFDLPEASQVTLKVYDSIGREVATLINEYRPAGTYEQQFDLGRLASGLYIYRLNSGAHTSVKTMLLLK